MDKEPIWIQNPLAPQQAVKGVLLTDLDGITFVTLIRIHL